MAQLATDGRADPAFRALALALPSVDTVAAEIAAEGGIPDPDRIYGARRRLNRALAEQLGDQLPALYDAMAVPGPYTPDADAAGKRALRGRMLSLITALDPAASTAAAQFETADNMTESLAALGVLVAADRAAPALAAFHARWRGDANVIDKWFAIQTANAPPEAALLAAERLSQHPDFTWKTPNRFRALLGGFAAQNTAGFHRADGAGYDFVAKWLLQMDAVNPQITARVMTVFDSWRRYDATRQGHAHRALGRIAGKEGLSRDTTEMVSRLLEG